MIDNITVEKIKSAAGIVSVVGDFVRLRKYGINYKGVCPFHDDHSPSLSVSPKKNIYHCFVCGAHGNPVDFLMNHPESRLSYPDALRYLAKKYSIWIDEESQKDARWQHVKPAQPRTAEEVKPLEMLTIDKDIVTRTMKLRDENTFVRWVRQLPWKDDARQRVEQMLWAYCVGHFRKDSRTVFWQIDEQGRVHTGKLMMYGADGKRNREGAFKNPGWAHNYLRYDKNRYGMQQCLFGMHLVDRYPDVPVNVVESEKTAVICAINYGLDRGLWMACGGLQNIKEFELQPLIDRGRDIFLWPDKDGREGWELFADGLSYDRLNIWTKFLQDNWTEADGPKADVADIILRLLTTPAVTIEPREPRPDGVDADDWQQHTDIMQAISEWQQAHPDGEPFEHEPTDPHVREWQERMRTMNKQNAI